MRQNYPDFFIFTSFIFIIFFYSDKMKSLKNLRDAIIRAHERDKKQVEIAEFLGICHPMLSQSTLIGETPLVNGRPIAQI